MAFILAHGASGMIALRIRGERDRDRQKVMVQLSSSYVRHGLGLPSIQDQRRKRQAPPPATDDELALILDSSRPRWAAAVGIGGIVTLTWLMMLKPF